MKNKKIILDLCGGTGSWAKPWKDAGYDVRNITLPKYDVRTYKPPKNVFGILAAPPCTEFSVAKNSKINRNFKKGMEIVDACMRIINECNPVFWALENPAGHLKNFLGHPAFVFEPWEFGDGWSKRTMVWGRFNLPKTKYKRYSDAPQVKGAYIRPGRKTVSIAFNHFITHGRYFKQLRDFLIDIEILPRHQRDGAFRAITPPGFSKAFFKANQ